MERKSLALLARLNVTVTVTVTVTGETGMTGFENFEYDPPGRDTNVSKRWKRSIESRTVIPPPLVPGTETPFRTFLAGRATPGWNFEEPRNEKKRNDGRGEGWK